MHSRIRYGLLATTAAAAAFTLAACGGGTTGAGATTSATSAGAAASSSTASTSTAASSSAPLSTMSSAAGSTAGSAVSTEHNDADVTFAQMMIVHHQGAIEMAALAPDRAQSQQVKDLAARIEAAQAPEIDQMNSWLTAWGISPMSSGMTMSGDPTSTSASDGMGDMGGMDHGNMDMGGGPSAQSPAAKSSSMPDMSMPGMMSAEQMQQLQSASGAAFDKLFLQLMITHHQGAIEMADTELADGSNPQALALAQKIKADQTAEITEMQTLLQSL